MGAFERLGKHSFSSSLLATLISCRSSNTSSLPRTRKMARRDTLGPLMFSGEIYWKKCGVISARHCYRLALRRHPTRSALRNVHSRQTNGVPSPLCILLSRSYVCGVLETNGAKLCWTITSTWSLRWPLRAFIPPLAPISQLTTSITSDIWRRCYLSTRKFL